MESSSAWHVTSSLSSTQGWRPPGPKAVTAPWGWNEKMNGLHHLNLCMDVIFITYFILIYNFNMLFWILFYFILFAFMYIECSNKFPVCSLSSNMADLVWKQNKKGRKGTTGTARKSKGTSTGQESRDVFWTAHSLSSDLLWQNSFENSILFSPFN